MEKLVKPLSKEICRHLLGGACILHQKFYQEQTNYFVVSTKLAFVARILRFQSFAECFVVCASESRRIDFGLSEWSIKRVWPRIFETYHQIGRNVMLYKQRTLCNKGSQTRHFILNDFLKRRPHLHGDIRNPDSPQMLDNMLESIAALW